MPEQNVTRKLTAIFYADVAGYSRLTGADELGAHRRVMDALDRATEMIHASGGRVLRYAGDAILAEFSSAVTAVEAAVRIQQAAARRDRELKEDDKARIRIGVNLGEVLEDREEIYGDGVNLAARLEAAAEPGGVCISSVVWDQVAGKADVNFEDGGEQRFKNIAKPVRVFHWRPDSTVAPHANPALPSKPSVAVLPLQNMSTDPEQEFFADGITEDIITELSKFRSLFVIARNSSFSFKGKAVDVKDASSKLGVRYIVEGSVRRAGKRIRVTAQLVDAVEDKHIWAERYDRDLEDIFAVQDEVTQAIVTAIEPQLISTERQRVRRKPTDSLDAWESYQRGLWHVYQYTEQDTKLTLEFMEKAIELDPSFASAHGGLAFALYVYLLFDYAPGDRELDLIRGLEAGQMAVRLDDSDPFAHVGLGRIHIIRGEHEQAIAAFDRAVELTPSLAVAHYGRAHALWHCGRAAEAVASHDEAMRLSPRDPLRWTFLASKAIALVMLKRYEDALECSREAQQQPITAIWAHMGELSALGQLGRKEEARIALDRAHKVKPDLTISFIERALPITHAESRALFLGGLRLAGVPA